MKTNHWAIGLGCKAKIVPDKDLGAPDKWQKDTSWGNTIL